MMSVGAEVLCTIAKRLAEEYDMGRRSHVADFSRACSNLTLIVMPREIRAAGRPRTTEPKVRGSNPLGRASRFRLGRGFAASGERPEVATEVATEQH